MTFLIPPLTPWERASRWILRAEGGYVNNPSDKGGPTNMGITAGTLRDAIDARVVGAGTTIAKLTRDQALAIYRSLYYAACHCQDMPAPIGLALFDSAVHSGIERASRWLQKAVNAAGGTLSEDGVIGFETVAQVQAHHVGPIVDSLLDQRRAFLRELAKRPGQGQFSNGWQSRVNELEAECRKAMEVA